MGKIKDITVISSIGERLTYLRELGSIPRTRFSKLSGISYNTLKVWESAKIKKLKSRSALKILSVFESLGVICTEEWFLEGKGPPPILVESLPAVVSNTTEENMYKELEFFKTLNENSSAILVTDTSMVPFYEPGDIVAGIKINSQHDNKLFLGKFCIIESIDGMKLLRKVLPGDVENTYNLSVVEANISNFPLLYNMKLSYAAPVIWHRKKGNA